jgi:hypothetical protein
MVRRIPKLVKGETMADSIQDFTLNADGSAGLAVVFDVTGMGFDPALAQNYTPFSLPAPADGSTWTQDTAVAALAAPIAASKAAFMAAAPNFAPPS